MKLSTGALSLTAIVGLGSTTTNAFVAPSTSASAWDSTRKIVSSPPARSRCSAIVTTTSSSAPSSLRSLNMATDDSTDDEIERLRSMAAKLRAEASALGKLGQLLFFGLSELKCKLLFVHVHRICIVNQPDSANFFTHTIPPHNVCFSFH